MAEHTTQRKPRTEDPMVQAAREVRDAEAKVGKARTKVDRLRTAEAELEAAKKALDDARARAAQALGVKG